MIFDTWYANLRTPLFLAVSDNAFSSIGGLSTHSVSSKPTTQPSSWQPVHLIGLLGRILARIPHADCRCGVWLGSRCWIFLPHNRRCHLLAGFRHDDDFYLNPLLAGHACASRLCWPGKRLLVDFRVYYCGDLLLHEEK